MGVIITIRINSAPSNTINIVYRFSLLTVSVKELVARLLQKFMTAWLSYQYQNPKVFTIKCSCNLATRMINQCYQHINMHRSARNLCSCLV